MLNWIVPCRRAVVTERCSYSAIIDSWRHKLLDHKNAIMRWYALRDERLYEAAANSLATWGGSAHPAVPGGTTSVDRLPNFWVRLWRGPYRILRPNVEPPEVTNAINQNSQREVRIKTAEFFPGDLLEFPIFKFLAPCGKGRNWYYMRFNGEGSPFLGNTVFAPSLDGSGRDPAIGEYQLHDNMLAMRFQLVINVAIGAFVHDYPVYKEGRNLLGTVEGLGIHARGMMFGGPFFHRIDSINGVDSWTFGTLGWGQSGGPRPTTAAIAKFLLPNQPLTPAWACSPSALGLSFPLLDYDHAGENGVSFEFGVALDHSPWFGDRASWRPPPQGRFVVGDSFNFIRRNAIVSDSSADPATTSMLPADGTTPTWGRMGDLNILWLERHEQSMIRLFPPSRLVQDELVAPGRPPVVGFLSAYNPVTGVDYFQDNRFDRVGQLFRFEAAGSLHPPEYGSRPHYWEAIGDNLLHWRRVHGGGWEAKFRSDDDAYQYTNGITTLDLNEQTLGNVYTPGKTYRPIVLSYQQARERIPFAGPRTASEMYADRAVPLLSMGEFIQHNQQFPNVATLRGSHGQAQSPGAH